MEMYSTEKSDRTHSSFTRAVYDRFYSALRKEDKIHLCALLMIVLVGIGVRLYFLSEPILQDESRTFVNCAFKPLSVGLTDYSSTNNHLFHTFLVHMAYVLLGNKPWMLRLPALVAGILVMPALYVVMRLFYSKEAALLTTGIAASSAPLVRYSILARGYSLICLIFLLLLWLATFLRKSTNSNLWLLFGILSALGFYTVPIMVYPFAIVVTWLFLSIMIENPGPNRWPLLKRLFRSIAITVFLTVILYFPVIVISGLKSIVANENMPRVSWSDFIRDLPPMARVIWGDWNRDIPAAIGFLLIIGFFISLVFHNRLSNHRIPMVLATAICLPPILIIHRVIPPERTLLFLLLVYLGTASSGLTYLLGRTKMPERYKPVTFTVLATALSLCVTVKVVRVQYIYDPIGTVRDAEQVTLFLKDYLRPGDTVLAPGATSLYYYYFSLHEIPVAYLNPDIEECSRILYITSEYRQRAETALAEQGTSIGERFEQLFPAFGETRLVKQYQFATLYELDRVTHAAAKQ